MAKKPIKILYGGSFNPFHEGHQWVISQLDQLKADEIIIMPNYTSPHKVEIQRESSEVLKEIRGFLKTKSWNTQIEVSDIELNRKGISYTKDTLLTLKKNHPNSDWKIALGLDSFLKIEKWEGLEFLLTEAQFIVVYRKGYDKKDFESLCKRLKIEDQVTWIGGVGVEISSTQLREKQR